VAEARDLFATVDQMIGWSNDRAERTTRKGRSMPVKAQRQERARACPARAAVSLTLFPITIQRRYADIRALSLGEIACAWKHARRQLKKIEASSL